MLNRISLTNLNALKNDKFVPLVDDQSTMLIITIKRSNQFMNSYKNIFPKAIILITHSAKNMLAMIFKI
jgi:hypothetical protein